MNPSDVAPLISSSLLGPIGDILVQYLPLVLTVFASLIGLGFLIRFTVRMLFGMSISEFVDDRFGTVDFTETYKGKHYTFYKNGTFKSKDL